LTSLLLDDQRQDVRFRRLGTPGRRGAIVSIITVDGLIDGSELGHTLSHEHIFIDTSPDYREPPPHIQSLLDAMDVDLEAPITLKGLGFLRREPQWSVDNQRVDSYEDMV
jgi:predicted metal-dependent phosphotriesterase family hydrolase